MEVTKLDSKDIEEILDAWLATYNRKLTPQQRFNVIGASQQCGASPLYLKVINWYNYNDYL